MPQVTWPLTISLALAIQPLAVSAQGPLTRDSLRAARREAASIVRDIDSLNRADASVQQRARQLLADFAEHNAEPCEYPQGQPELCASYETERLLLNDRSAALQKELRAIDTPRRGLRSRFASLLQHFTTASYAPDVADRKALIGACATLNGVTDAAACLIRAVGP